MEGEGVGIRGVRGVRRGGGGEGVWGVEHPPARP